MEPEPVKVRSGTFRVDRKEALRKLAAYRLADPAAFVLCWVRAASGSRPTWIHVSLARYRVSVRFDGKAWGAGALEDPYTAFFEEGGEPRVRHLVTGALASFELGARRVRVTAGGRTVEMTAEAVEPVEEPADRTETAFEARWDVKFGEQDLKTMASLLGERCGMLQAELMVEVEDNAWAVGKLAGVAGAPSVAFEDEGLRAFLRPPKDPRARTGRAAFYSAGVLVSEVDWSFSPAQVEAHLDDDAFALDASQSSVVMDATFQRALDAAGARIPKLLTLALDRHELEYADWARFLFDRKSLFSPLIRKGRYDRPRAIDRALAWLAGYEEEYSRLTEWDGGAGAWLRTAASVLPVDEPAERVLKRLFHAQLYLTVNGTLMTLEDLDRTAKLCGELPVCRKLFPGEFLDPPVIWCPWRGDAVVERRFGERAHWHTDISTFRDIRPSGTLRD